MSERALKILQRQVTGVVIIILLACVLAASRPEEDQYNISACMCASVCQRRSQFVNVLEAEITDPGGCVYTKVGEGRTLGGALRAHTLTTVPTVVL